MDRRTFVKTVPALAMMASTSSSFAEELQPITLPKPEKDGGKSVLAALWERRTTRNIREEKLPPQVLSNLLWAAFGVNREAGPFGQPGRTAASASNSQEIDLYVALPEGIYLYEAAAAPPGSRRRRGPAREGRRSRSPGRAAKAPVSLIFVADIAKYAKARLQEPGLKDPEVQKSYYNVASG